MAKAADVVPSDLRVEIERHQKDGKTEELFAQSYKKLQDLNTLNYINKLKALCDVHKIRPYTDQKALQVLTGQIDPLVFSPDSIKFIEDIKRLRSEHGVCQTGFLIISAPSGLLLPKDETNCFPIGDEKNVLEKIVESFYQLYAFAKGGFDKAPLEGAHCSTLENIKSVLNEYVVQMCSKVMRLVIIYLGEGYEEGLILENKYIITHQEFIKAIESSLSANIKYLHAHGKEVHVVFSQCYGHKNTYVPAPSALIKVMSLSRDQDPRTHGSMNWVRDPSGNLCFDANGCRVVESAENEQLNGWYLKWLIKLPDLPYHEPKPGPISNFDESSENNPDSME